MRKGIQDRRSNMLLREMCYRILSGDYLIKKILEDTMTGISLLSEFPGVDKNRIGTLGHSMGGNTVQFLAAMDERISFACASGHLKKC